MPRPLQAPIGLHLSATARAVGRAFDAAMEAAGGSQSAWVIIIALKTHRVANQRELAEAVGIQQATLTHHLNAMEDEGLIVRRRDSTNRRIQQVSLTDSGEATFLRLRRVAMAFDERLRNGLDDESLRAFRSVLEQFEQNVSPSPKARPSVAGSDTPGH